MNSDVKPYPRDPEVNIDTAAAMNVDAAEWERILGALGRVPTYAELGVFSVMWSEHCSYKSSRMHLRRLPTKGEGVVQGPGENAGAVDIGDGYAAVFKMESHNHPSFIEPYQGAATGVGGILRDVFTMGARPVALLNSLRFGRPDHAKTQALLKGVVAGIAGYGNAIGVPTVGGEVQFDSSYDGNILVNAFALGIARSDKLFFGRAEGIGNPVIYVGAKTGRDGVFGATMASQEFDEQSAAKLPTVQVGDPFKEKLLLEACLEIFERECLVGVQDMGAAGLTSSSVEMAARSGSGIELDLDKVPRRTRNLHPFEMLLSESQERMLMVAKPGREAEVFEICQKWDLDYAVIGKVTDTGRFVCTATPGFDPYVDAERPFGREAITVVDLPIAALTDDAPIYDRPQSDPGPLPPRPDRVVRVDDNDPGDLKGWLLRLLGSPNIGSRQWIYRQYDHIVRTGTMTRPETSDAAVVRAFCAPHIGDAALSDAIQKTLALSVDCNGRQVLLDPYQGAMMVVAECARNLRCSGAKPLGLTDCLNFGSPKKPDTMWRIARAIDGLSAACTALKIPVVSGNVSLYNETDGQPILPTPTVAIVGQIASPSEVVLSRARQAGDVMIHLGPPSRGKLDGSEYAVQKDGGVFGTSPGIDMDAEIALHAVLGRASAKRLLHSAHDVSDGGILVTIAETLIHTGLGARLRTLPGSDQLSLIDRAFSEEPSRVVVTVPPVFVRDLEALCRDYNVPFLVMGEISSEPTLVIDDVLSVPTETLSAVHSAALSSIVS